MILGHLSFHSKKVSLSFQRRTFDTRGTWGRKKSVKTYIWCSPVPITTESEAIKRNPYILHTLTWKWTVYHLTTNGTGIPPAHIFWWVIILATSFMWYQWNGFLTGIFSDGDLFYNLGDQFSASCFQPFETCNWCKSHQLLTCKSKSKAPARLQSMVSFAAFAGVLPPHSTWSGHWSNVWNSFEPKKSFLGDWMMMWPPFAPNNLANLGRCVEAIGWSTCTSSHLFLPASFLWPKEPP